MRQGMDWGSIVWLPGNMKDAPEVYDHKFEVRTVICHFSPAKFNFVGANKEEEKIGT